MEIITQHSKPKPILGVCFPQIFLPEHKITHLKPQDQTRFALLKYLPKYIDSLPSNLSNLKTRIKHIKLVKKIPSDHPNNVLRVLLQNKRKNIQFVNGVENRDGKGGYNKKTLELLKMLPNVQKVEFCAEIQFEEDEEYQLYQKIECYWIDRMSNYLPHMKNLKYLRLANRGRYFLPLLSKLNSFETMLSRLKVFKLDFAQYNSEDFPFFQALFDSKIVLKYLTHLILNLPGHKDFFELYQLLPDYCPRLLSLFSVLDQKNSFLAFEDVSCLQCLQGFQNLQKVSLWCLYNLDVFRHCKFPASLRYLDLYFDEIDWQSLMTKKVFSHKQEGLENLEKLQVFLYRYRPNEEEDIVKDFLKDLLSRILTLREFNMELFPKRRVLNSLYSFDISHFFSCFQHLGQSLQKLSITDGNGAFNFTNFGETQAFHFTELSYLSIQSESLPSLPEIENIIRLMQVKPNAPAPEIKLKRMKIDSCKALLELFSSLKKISGKQIELVVSYENKKWNDEYFKENYDEVKKDSRNLRNVDLEIRFSAVWPKFRWMKEMKSLEGLFSKLILTENVFI